MAAGTYHIICEQGATFTRELTWSDENDQPIILSGYTARMQVRQSLKSTTTVLELTSENGRLVIYPATGKIVLSISAAETAALPAKVCVYDLEMISAGGIVTRLVEGSFTVRPEVTR